MTERAAFALGAGDEDVVSLDAALAYARRHDLLEFVHAAARHRVVEQEALRRGLEPTLDEVQAEVDRFRREEGLTSAQATLQWLRVRDLTADDLQARARDVVLQRRVRDAVTRHRVAEHFHQHRDDFEAASVSRIRHRDEGVIREIQIIVFDGDQDFASLARQCSEDEASAEAGGYLGWVPLGDLPDALRQPVRDASPPQVFEPVVVRGAWELYRVEAYAPPVLDAAMERRVADALFEAWLGEQLTGLRILPGSGP